MVPLIRFAKLFISIYNYTNYVNMLQVQIMVKVVLVDQQNLRASYILELRVYIIHKKQPCQ